MPAQQRDGWRTAPSTIQRVERAAVSQQRERRDRVATARRRVQRRAAAVARALHGLDASSAVQEHKREARPARARRHVQSALLGRIDGRPARSMNADPKTETYQY